MPGTCPGDVGAAVRVLAGGRGQQRMCIDAAHAEGAGAGYEAGVLLGQSTAFLLHPGRGEACPGR